MIIRDEIHGNLEFNSIEERIIDCKDFQRLRRIKQMSVTNLVYPGATHTRFEHSLGTAYLSEEIGKKVGLSKDEIQIAKLNGLLHDIGHTPFSHEGEDVLEKYVGNHEQIGNSIISKSNIGDILKENYSINDVIENNMIITSDIGSDRMDYLKRDAMNTGVAYGLIDIERILHTISIDKELFIRKGGLSAAEYLLIARFMMFFTVYLHKTVRIATAMLHRAIEKGIDEGIDPKIFSRMDDEEASCILGMHMNDIKNRKLYKEICSIDRKNATKKLEKELCNQFEIEIIIDRPKKFFKPSSIKVENEGELIDISEVSDIIQSLKISEERRMKALVLVKEENKEKYQSKIIASIGALQSEQ